MARLEALDSGADDAIMLDLEGYVTEGRGANVFIVRTVSSLPHRRGCSKVTRETVFELAVQEGLPARRRLTRYDLYNADEVFYCTTAGGIMPIVEVDRRQVGSGLPGAIPASAPPTGQLTSAGRTRPPSPHTRRSRRYRTPDNFEPAAVQRENPEEHRVHANHDDECLQNRLGELDVQHVVHPLTNLHAHQMQGPLIWDRGEGIYLYDTNGKRYIDAAAGMWNVNVGHGRTELAEVAATQMGRLEYASSFGGASNQPSIELAERVARLVPGDLNTILFTAGGSSRTIARSSWPGSSGSSEACPRSEPSSGATWATTVSPWRRRKRREFPATGIWSSRESTASAHDQRHITTVTVRA